jgi:hypothetical protein
VTGRRGRKRKHLMDDLKIARILEFERVRARSHSFEISLWKRLWTYSKAD